MKFHRYTNKNEKPVPRYNEGQKVWMEHCGIENYSVEYTIIRKVNEPRWVDYSESYCRGCVPHWEITYRHKPQLNDRMAQFSVNEEELYDTEADAVKAMFEKFYNDTCRQLGNFKKRYKRLGISYEPMLKIIENKEKT